MDIPAFLSLIIMPYSFHESKKKKGRKHLSDPCMVLTYFSLINKCFMHPYQDKGSGSGFNRIRSPFGNLDDVRVLTMNLAP